MDNCARARGGSAGARLERDPAHHQLLRLALSAGARAVWRRVSPRRLAPRESGHEVAGASHCPAGPGCDGAQLQGHRAGSSCPAMS
eukprot:4023297-Pyramimonas_sp.AAC.1